jgi:hypothetical protein
MSRIIYLTISVFCFAWTIHSHMEPSGSLQLLVWLVDPQRVTQQQQVGIQQ